MIAQTSITIEPIVSYPREAEPGKTYLMTVDLRFPAGKEEWPYDEEEHEIYCLLDSAPLFDNEELGEAVIVLHRFGGTYGPAMFLLTANRIEMNEPAGVITLTLANRQLMPLQVFKLDKIRVSTKATTASETVTITRQQPVASVGIGIEFKEQPLETPAPSETEFPETETSSTAEGTDNPPLVLPAGIKLRRRFGPVVLIDPYVDSVAAPIEQIAWSPNGLTLAALVGGNTVVWWDLKTGQDRRRTLPESPAKSLAWSPDSDKLALAHPRTISIPSFSTEDWLQQVYEFNSEINDAQWSPDQRWLGVATEDGRIILRDGSDWTERQRFEGDGSPARCLAWRLQGDYFLSGYGSGQLRLWASQRSVRARFPSARRPPQSSTEENYWASGARLYEGHKARVNSVAWSPRGVYFASGSDDGTVRLWRVDEPDDNFQIMLEGHTQTVTRVCFSPTGDLLASKSNDGTVRIWKLSSYQCVAVIDASAAVSGQPPLPSSVLAFHPSEPLLATCLESDQTISTLDLDVRTLLETTTQVEGKAKQARVFISHEYGAEPDSQLAKQVERALSDQYAVFTAEDFGVAEVWAKRIEKEISECDHLIVILSAQSAGKEWITAEIRRAHEQAQQQNGRPKILPVRVAYREPFSPELGSYLNHIQWAHWDTPSDTPRLIEQLKRAIAGEELPATGPEDESRKRVFFAYKRDVEPDESTARQIAEALSERHDVFIDYKMPIGVRWAETIKKAFDETRVLVVLLTAESIRSEWVRTYLRLASERSETHGGPLKIIPVRLAYRDPLPEDLADFNRMQQIAWQGPEDTPRVIDKIQQMLGSSTRQTDAPEAGEESEPSSRYLEIEARSNQETIDNLTSSYSIRIPGKAETHISTNETLLLDGIISRSIQSSSFDERLAEELRRYLLPDSIQSEFGELNNFILSLDKSSAQYPWELLLNPTEDGLRPLAIRGEMIRQFKNSRPTTMPTYATERNALVVNDAYSRYPELRGAAEETRSAAGLLSSHGYDASYFNRGDADEIVTRLHERESQILHLSSQISQGPNNIGTVGIAIGEKFILTANEISTLRAIPELVFLNFMHPGNADVYARIAQGKLHQLAADLAADWMAAGVKGLVITGWTVDERAAVTFTSGFYEQFLNGHPFGEAVLSARRLTYEQHRRTNTWGAYQCYGDPEFRLSPPPTMAA